MKHIKNSNSKQSTLRFYNIGRTLYHLAQYHAPKESITLEQLQALIFISEKKQVKMNDLAKFLSISAATATSLGNRLIANGWLTRSEDPKDRRIVKIALKPDAEAKLQNILEYKSKTLNDALAVLTQEEREQFFCVLEKLESYLTEQAYNHKTPHNKN